MNVKTFTPTTAARFESTFAGLLNNETVVLRDNAPITVQFKNENLTAATDYFKSSNDTTHYANSVLSVVNGRWKDEHFLYVKQPNDYNQLWSKFSFHFQGQNHSLVVSGNMDTEQGGRSTSYDITIKSSEVESQMCSSCVLS
jgi:hypothetical protein